MHSLESVHSWFALRIKPRHEKAVSTALRGKGYEEFLPLYRSRHRSSGRMQDVSLPLFPGYLFCRFNPLNRLPILATPGVFLIVGIGKSPVPVEDREVEAIQVVVRSGLKAEPWPFLEVGQVVRVEEGPLNGTEGILLKSKNEDRLIISVSLLQRSVAVEVDRKWVCPVKKSIGAVPSVAAPAKGAIA